MSIQFAVEVKNAIRATEVEQKISASLLGLEK